MRLQKFLARAGVASRRKSEELITAGRVSVDGRVVSRLGSAVDPATQRVDVDGRPVTLPPARWLAMHKPPGVLTARSDPEGRPTIYGLLPEDVRTLFHVGRLDFMSEGLILLTNDGDAAHGLLHPSRRVPRSYEVTLVGPASPRLPDTLVGGVELDDGPARATSAAFLTACDDSAPVLALTLVEGRNREVRRMMKSLGVRIRRLKRVALGPIGLADLAPGAHRPLSDGEMAAIESIAGDDGTAKAQKEG